MKPKEQKEILTLLDFERQTVIYPGTTRFSDIGIIRDVSDDGKNCEIVYSSCSENDLDQTIKHQIEVARNARYELEWKVYGHDRPHDLGERLLAAGFKTGEKEMFMVSSVNNETLNRFDVCSCDIRCVTSKEGLKDVQMISEEVYAKSYETQITRWGAMLENHPQSMSIYVAYIDGEPAASGRVYFQESSKFAGLFGGQTRERFRKRGLFTQLVAVRIREALSRRIAYICVDALPTSEPILRKRGFESVTYTQPFCFSE